MKRSLLLTLAMLFFVPNAFSQNEAKINLIDNHRVAWETFLTGHFDQFDSESKVESQLLKFSSQQYTVYLGGSGEYQRVYIIDDFIQILATFGKNRQLRSIPKIMPRGKWLKYPSGIAIDVASKGSDMSPEEFLKYFENALMGSGIE